MKIWKTLIVDDERLARKKLRSLLSENANIEIVGEADSVPQAAEQIETTKPEIIFLDIQMPGASGFDLLETIETDAKIVFVTAYDEFAVRAFEVNALDYLLKPVNRERLAQTVARFEDATEKKSIDDLNSDDFILASSGRKSKFVKVAAIKCVMAAGVYSEILTIENGKFLFSRSLSEWENRLPAKNFLRIHRSIIVNLEFIERIEKSFSRVRQIYLRDCKEPFTISRRYANHLKDKFG